MEICLYIMCAKRESLVCIEERTRKAQGKQISAVMERATKGTWMEVGAVSCVI